MYTSIKHTILAFALLLTCSLQAQITVAEDWSQVDCDGTDHNLFSTLDTGAVVVMEIVMLDGCMPCINTALLIGPVIDSYNALYENRIKYYTFGYNDTYSCDDLLAWKIENEITCHAQFVEGEEIGNYYGGMGMPTIVVVGRNTHQVYFNQFGFVHSDTIEFADALEYALGLAEPVGIQGFAADALTCYPNPATNELLLTGVENNAQVAIYDSFGSNILSVVTSNKSIDITTLPSGIYRVVVNANGVLSASGFVKL